MMAFSFLPVICFLYSEQVAECLKTLKVSSTLAPPWLLLWVAKLGFFFLRKANIDKISNGERTDEIKALLEPRE